MSIDYGFKKVLEQGFDGVLERVVQALKQEGFGVLTEIDVKATLKKKLDLDFPHYKILGACNPPLAHQALEAEPDIGLMLPCNVIVYREGEEGGKTVATVIKPSAAMGMIDNLQLVEVARTVEEKLKRVFEAV